jgi:TonB family protein
MRTIKFTHVFFLVLITFSCAPKKKENLPSKYSILPAPKLGLEALYKCIQEKLQIPKAALDAKIEGSVLIEFTVNVKGEAFGFKSLNSLGLGCEEAAVNALINCKMDWNPGKENTEVVDMKIKVPITFALK